MDNIHMFLNAQDLSLQEMLDTDMRTEIDNVFGHSDLSLSLSDLPPLDLDESLGGPCDMPMWFTSSVLSGRDSDSCDSNFNLDLAGNDGAGKMVDPTSVMPCLTAPAYRSPSPATFETPPPAQVKFVVDATRQNIRVAQFAMENKVKVQSHVQIQGGIRTLNGNSVGSGNHVVVKKSVNNFSKHFHNGAVSVDGDYDDLRLYPKPAYSYSCLIAMALKNSATGSLPVSEIYNFMCEHFPYFKTAPNGWKNSVRHNLSLNKCFEKIEKPAGNGSQRKGCLWAMNPGKIAKMDEEVQKWSKKDPLAIKKAMINPGSVLKKATVSRVIAVPTANITETLDMLERGDLKRDFAPASTSSGGSVSDESDDDGPSRRDRPPSDDQESSSDQDDYDIEVGDGLFEEEEEEEDDDEDEDSKLGLGLTFTAAPSELLGISLASSARLITTTQQQQQAFAGKRAKVAASIHGNYVYKPMTGGWDTGDRKRKPPLLLRGSGNSIGSSLIKVEDSL